MAKGRQHEVYKDEDQRIGFFFKMVLSVLLVLIATVACVSLVMEFNREKILSEASHVYLDNVEVDKDDIDLKLFDYMYEKETNSLYLVEKSKDSTGFIPIYVYPGHGF